MQGEWEPDEDIKLNDPLHVSDEEWEKRYKGIEQGGKLVAAGGLLLLADLLFSILEGIGDGIDSLHSWYRNRRNR